MKKLVLALVLLIPALLQAQTYPVNSNGGNITSTNANCVPSACVGIKISNVGTISVVVTGTFSATLAVESSADGTTFASAGTSLTSTGTTTYSTTGVVLFRVRASAFVSGNAGVNITTSSGGGGTGTVTTVASGTAALGTSAIASATCATVVTVAASGVATTDNIMADFNADPTGVVGYQASSNGMLTIIKYPTANNVNFKVCNNTTASITPGAITLNWRVVR